MGIFDFFKESEEHKQKRLQKRAEINEKFKNKMNAIDEKQAKQKAELSEKLKALDEKNAEKMEESKIKYEESKKKLQESIDHFNELKHTCPVCGNKTDFTAYEKGYGVGKGLVGAAIFGPLGFSAGLIGKGKIFLVCNKCGHKMKI